MRARAWAVALGSGLVWACSIQPGGGTGAEGRGGGGGSEAPPVVTAAVPGAEVSIRSQLFAPRYTDDPGIPDAYLLHLLDQGHACTAEGGLLVEESEGWLRVEITSPAVGECPVIGGFPNTTGREAEVPEPAGCVVRVEAGRGRSTVTEARGGSARIDRISGDTIAGELRLRFTSPPVINWGCSTGWAGGPAHGWEFIQADCVCASPSGSFECVSTDVADQDCCDDGGSTVEVVIPLEATRCPAAGSCWVSPCAPNLVGACRPDEPPPASCDAACADHVAVCRSCLCADGTCEDFGRCDHAACVGRCERLAAADPLVALSLACAEAAAGSCGRWASCVSACGP